MNGESLDLERYQTLLGYREDHQRGRGSGIVFEGEGHLEMEYIHSILMFKNIL